MNCMLDISKIFYTHYNMEKRFTYSPAMQYSDSKAPSFISFQEFQKSGKVYSQGYQPVSYQQVQLPNVYTASVSYATSRCFRPDKSPSDTSKA